MAGVAREAGDSGRRGSEHQGRVWRQIQLAGEGAALFHRKCSKSCFVNY